eukprot:1674668-Rhodomonas_salina.1
MELPRPGQRRAAARGRCSEPAGRRRRGRDRQAHDPLGVMGVEPLSSVNRERWPSSSSSSAAHSEPPKPHSGGEHGRDRGARAASIGCPTRFHAAGSGQKRTCGAA